MRFNELKYLQIFGIVSTGKYLMDKGAKMRYNKKTGYGGAAAAGGNKDVLQNNQ